MGGDGRNQSLITLPNRGPQAASKSTLNNYYSEKHEYGGNTFSPNMSMSALGKTSPMMRDEKFQRTQKNIDAKMKEDFERLQK